MDVEKKVEERKARVQQTSQVMNERMNAYRNIHAKDDHLETNVLDVDATNQIKAYPGSSTG